MIQLLVQAKTETCVARTKDQQIALHFARMRQANTVVFKALLEGGPRTISVLDQQEQLPLHVAWEGVQLLRDAFAHGANAPNKLGQTPVDLAKLHRRDDSIMKLLERSIE
jgi:ankyrin repeat protein